MTEQIVITLLDYIGTFAFAVSGALAAAEKKFDIFGAIFLGFVTAIGGGTLRDCMIGNTPVAWLHNINIFYTILFAVLITFLFRTTIVKFFKTLFLFDTIGISVFTIIGIQKGFAADISTPTAIMMGIATAVVGGVFRDVLCNDIPLIFHKEIYATACLVGGVAYVLLLQFDFNGVAAIVAACLIFAVRTLSVRYNWSLPKFK
ncbi:MAG: trimeric intracellular cation channel family protein [Bacteroidales bacterium]|jgi:uncharacterized membrane protein YeiH|nr:trimeric intracellular cation channel family protein [Bacteroidales bacterium]